jgi:hypothetical protein
MPLVTSVQSTWAPFGRPLDLQYTLPSNEGDGLKKADKLREERQFAKIAYPFSEHIFHRLSSGVSFQVLVPVQKDH